MPNLPGGTDAFGRPLPAPTPKPLNQPGEYTQMFGRGTAAPQGLPAPPQPAVPLGGSATQQFSANMPYAGGVPVAPAEPQGPSEYTRMFAAPPAQPLPDSSALAHNPQPPLPLEAPRRNLLPIIAILAGLLVIAIIAVLFFAFRKK
jgi:hypothetical protein